MLKAARMKITQIIHRIAELVVGLVGVSVLSAVLFVSPAFTLAQEFTRPASIDTMNSEIAATVQKLQDAQLWIGGSVTVSNGVRSKTEIYGSREPEKSVPPSKDSHFEIGSMSKSFTGILLEWLVETHPNVSLDDPIEKFVPSLSGYFSGKITLREIATQTSGLPDALCIEKTATTVGFCPVPADPANPWADTSEQQLLTYLTLFNRSGTGPFPYVYSNVGFITLGYVISAVAHQSYSELIRKVITKPLHMGETYVNLSNQAVSDYLPGFTVIQRPTEHWSFTEISAPAGGIVSTPHDMAKYLRANLARKHTLLGRAMESSHQDGAGWDSAPGDANTFKNGGTGGFSSIIYFNCKDQTGAVVLSNLSAVYSASLAVYPVFWPTYFGPTETFPDLAGVAVNPSTLASYAGTYTTNDKYNFPSPITIIPSGGLLRFLDGDIEVGSDLRLEPVSSTSFAATDGDYGLGSWWMNFQVGASGEVSGFTFVFNDGSGTPPDVFTKVRD